MPQGSNTKVTRLEDLLVEEVSVVDRPANKRRFLTVKNEGGMGDKGTEVVVDADGNLVTGGDAPAPAQEPVDLPFAFHGVGETLAAIEKRLALPAEFRDEIFRNLYTVMRRASAVLQTTEVVRSDDEGETPLAALIVGELDEIQTAIGDLMKKLGQVQKGEKPDLSAVEKAAWSAAQVNDFPDSSFLYIKPGGKKDAGGKTAPRTNRMFPVRDGNGNLDVAHLRNAIARAPQANVPDDVKRKVQEQARRLLAEAQKAKFVTRAGAKKSETEPETPTVEEGAEAKFLAFVEAVEKRGAKMSSDRLSRFKDALANLSKLLGELEHAQDVAPEKTTKSIGETAMVTKAVGELSGLVTKLTSVVQKQNRELRTLRSQTSGSNTIPVEKSDDRPAGDVSWPLDMNDPKTRETVDSSTSFIDS